MQVRGGACVAGRRWGWVGLGGGGPDALHHAVARVTDLDRPGAHPLESLGSVFAGQTKHTLGGAQPEQGIDLRQPGDDRGTGGADLGGLGAAPVRILKAIFSGG